MSRKILIMGAAGRDFHVFNCCYRDRTDVEVIAFTATQIPHIEDRRYPAALAGQQYPDGIPVHPEEELDDLIKINHIDEVVFAYSDVSHAYVDERRERVEAQGVTFSVYDVDATMLPSDKPVIAVCAVRTGCGKSQTSRRVTHLLNELGKKQIVIRHPMPYGNLAEQAVQRFAAFEDLDRPRPTWVAHAPPNPLPSPIEKLDRHPQSRLRAGAALFPPRPSRPAAPQRQRVRAARAPSRPPSFR